VCDVTGVVDEEAWRQAIRRQLELELDTQVKQALAPPSQLNEEPRPHRLKRIQSHRRDNISSNMFDHVTASDQEHEQDSTEKRQMNVSLNIFITMFIN